MGTTSCHSARHDSKFKYQSTYGKENSINSSNIQTNKENLFEKVSKNTDSDNIKVRKPFSDITNLNIHSKFELEDNIKKIKGDNILIQNQEPNLQLKDFDSIKKASLFLSDVTFIFQLFSTNLKMIDTFKYIKRKDGKISCPQSDQKNEGREHLKSSKKQKSKSFNKKSNLFLNEESLKEKELDDLFMRLPLSPNKSSASTPQFQPNTIKFSKKKNKKLEDYLPKDVLSEENVENYKTLEAYLFDNSENMENHDEDNLNHDSFHLSNNNQKNVVSNDACQIWEQPKMKENNLVISSLNSEDLKPRIFNVKQEPYEQFEVEEIKNENDEEECYETEEQYGSEELYYENEEISGIKNNDANDEEANSDQNIEIKKIYSQIYEKPYEIQNKSFNYNDQEKTNYKREYDEFIEMANTKKDFKDNEDKCDFSNIDSINLSQLTIPKKHPVFSEEEEGEDEAQMININLYELIQNRIKTKKNSGSNRRYMFEEKC